MSQDVQQLACQPGSLAVGFRQLYGEAGWLGEGGVECFICHQTHHNDLTIRFDTVDIILKMCMFMEKLS